MLATEIFNTDNFSELELSDLMTKEVRCLDVLDGVLLNDFYLVNRMIGDLDDLLNSVDNINYFFYANNLDEEEKTEIFLKDLLAVIYAKVCEKKKETPQYKSYYEGVYQLVESVFNKDERYFEIDAQAIKDLIMGFEEILLSNINKPIKKVYLYMIYQLRSILLDVDNVKE
ncbi:hypothetical protein [Volucribacter amazonae]|uniref:Uncharacterized protein n=1 Tax=Volucribacter amazonae TaxID=256731 RepID=A0A9X4SHJ7_9PAST|nr:hypothetical protein [Volucribacter amazonae]MDG6894570.1 hypothetical protein [Volucribacter amazonae]